MTMKAFLVQRLKSIILRVLSVNEEKLRQLDSADLVYISDQVVGSRLGRHVRLGSPCRIYDTSIGDYTYLAINSYVSEAVIGRFCSIGPNFICGWGIHPINGISSSPMFYSLRKQNGVTLSDTDKVIERRTIIIGNDVFIGMNVTVLDGVEIGDGAVIGAGAVVSKSIPPYAIAVGNPIRVVKYRFSPDIIAALMRIKWWEFDDENIKDVERCFFNVEGFVRKYDKINE